MRAPTARRASALEPDIPPDVSGVEERQRREHGHVEEEDVLRVLPYRVVRRDLLYLHQVWEVDRRRPRGVTPPSGRQPRQLVETGPTCYRDHPAGEHQLRHDRHHEERHDLLVGLRYRREHQTEDGRGHAGAGDGDEQRERGVVEERWMRSRRTLAEPDDERRDRRLDGRENTEDEDLGQQIGRGGQPDRLFPAEDGTLADQVADGQRRAPEYGSDVEQHHDVLRLGGRQAEWVGGTETRFGAFDSQRQRPDEERQHRQEHRVAAVGDDETNLAAGDRGKLAQQVGVHGFAEVRRDFRGRCPRLPSAAVSLQKAAIRFVWIGAYIGEDVRPVGGSQRSTDLAGRPVEGGLAAGGHQQNLIP